jgi:hypothetical protein
MEVSNIILVIIWINYMGMNGYLFKSTPKYKKYNKMGNDDGYDGVGAADGDEDDAQASKYPSRFSSCVVLMVEIFAASAMEAVERQGSTVVA